MDPTAMAGEHAAAMVALTYLPTTVLAALIGMRCAAAGRAAWAGRALTGYRASRPLVRMAALLMLMSATIHFSLIPAHADEPVTVALFALDGAGYVAVSIWAFVAPRWEPAALLLLGATVIAYVVYLLAGWETVDPVGVTSKIVECTAIALVSVHWLRSGRTSGERNPSLVRDYAATVGVIYLVAGAVPFVPGSLPITTANLLRDALFTLAGLAGLAAVVVAREITYVRSTAPFFGVVAVAGLLSGLAPLGQATLIAEALAVLCGGVVGWPLVRRPGLCLAHDAEHGPRPVG